MSFRHRQMEVELKRINIFKIPKLKLKTVRKSTDSRQPSVGGPQVFVEGRVSLRTCLDVFTCRLRADT